MTLNEPVIEPVIVDVVYGELRVALNFFQHIGPDLFTDAFCDFRRLETVEDSEINRIRLHDTKERVERTSDALLSGRE